MHANTACSRRCSLHLHHNRRRGTNHQQPDSGADCETRPRGRDQGPRAACRTRAACVPPIRTCRPPAGRASAIVRDLPDGRRFANDSRGFLYLLDPNNQPQVYANVAAAFPNAIYNRLESGFIGFAFHPEFARNGLFYTVHAERAAGNPKTPDFIPPGFALKDVTYHNVITEWHATNPAANTFEGTRRELLREAHVVANLTHPMGAVEFNPTAKPGDPDYGLLYTSGSDHGFSNGGGPNANNREPDAAPRLDHDRDPAHRSAQSVGDAAE